jgi:hypothetical protein
MYYVIPVLTECMEVGGIREERYLTLERIGWHGRDSLNPSLYYFHLGNWYTAAEPGLRERGLPPPPLTPAREDLRTEDQTRRETRGAHQRRRRFEANQNHRSRGDLTEKREGPIRRPERGSEWELIKILVEGIETPTRWTRSVGPPKSHALHFYLPFAKTT